MRKRRLIGRAARWQASRTWRDVRPGRRTDLSHRARSPVALQERPPGPDEAWLPATTATGPWAHIDPLVADSWRSTTAGLANLAMWAFIGLRARRAWTRLAPVEGSDGPGGADEDDG